MRCVVIGRNAVATEDDQIVINDEDGNEIFNRVDKRLSYALRLAFHKVREHYIERSSQPNNEAEVDDEGWKPIVGQKVRVFHDTDYRAGCRENSVMGCVGLVAEKWDSMETARVMEPDGNYYPVRYEDLEPFTEENEHEEAK